MNISIAIAVFDKTGVRHKRGDIIAVRRYPWAWGVEEYKQYLIVPIDTLGKIRKHQVPKLMRALLLGGGWDGGDPSKGPDFTVPVVAKNRFQVPKAVVDQAQVYHGLPAIQWARVINLEDTYQPFLTNLTTGEGYISPLTDAIYCKAKARIMNDADLAEVDSVGE